jgi:predicted transcriptional regulator
VWPQLDRGKQREAELVSSTAIKEESRVAVEVQATLALTDVIDLKVALQARDCDVSRLEQERLRVEAEWAGAKEACHCTETLLQQATAELTKTQTLLNNSEEMLAEGSLRAHKLAAQLKSKAEAMTDVETTLEATMQHCEDQRLEIDTAQAEAAALAAVATSAALALANAGSTLNQVCISLENPSSTLGHLGVPVLKVRCKHCMFFSEKGCLIS